MLVSVCVWRAAEQERGELEVHFFSFTTASKTEAELRLLALFFVYFYRGLDIILRSLVLLSEVIFFLTGGVLKCVMHLQLLGMSEERIHQVRIRKDKDGKGLRTVKK